MRREMLTAAIVAFVASFCTLVVEISAGRILAPQVGVSLYTWTSIIGVVLAGISLGAWAGGWLADRFPAPSTLGRLLLVSGVVTTMIAPFADYLATGKGVLTTMGIATTLVTRVVVLAVLLFLLPSFFLGMVSPVVVKMAVRDLATTGRTVGTIYAISTVGSIAGTFVTGFWLIARFGTRTTLAGVGAALLVTALLFGGLLNRRARAAAVLVIAAMVASAVARQPALDPPRRAPLLQPGQTGFLHDEESQYYRIRVERTVRKDNGASLNALHLDHLVHSYSDPSDPNYLHYEYLRIFDDLARQGGKRLLFVGGGGYTLPSVIAARDAEARIDVVEIDPAVTRVARQYFGLQAGPRIRPIHEDARWFAMHSRESYDLIFIDAFNDLSVPYHLTTLEAGLAFRRLLRPGGAIVANVVDDFARGRFLASYVRTMQSVFPDGSVVVVYAEPADLRSTRGTFVVVASEKRTAPSLRRWPSMSGNAMERWLSARHAIVLTDDYVPVDNMLAAVFRDRFAEEQR